MDEWMRCLDELVCELVKEWMDECLNVNLNVNVEDKVYQGSHRSGEIWKFYEFPICLQMSGKSRFCGNCLPEIVWILYTCFATKTNND